MSKTYSIQCSCLVSTEYEYFSLAEIRSKIATLKKLGVDIVSYDLEKDGSPARDLTNPVTSVKLASDVVHRNGLKFMVAPSRELTSLYGAQFAKFVDIYDIQAQSLQSKPNEYKNYIEQIVKKLRSNNAEISISAQVSTDRGSLDSMKNSISLVAESVDGVTSGIPVIKKPWLSWRALSSGLATNTKIK